jgi:hypothetical protein
VPATAKQEFEEAERRLQVRFPSQYRTWALARSRYRALKGFRLFVPAKCYDFVGSSGERSGIVIGATWEATHLVLKLTKQKDQSGTNGPKVTSPFSAPSWP